VNKSARSFLILLVAGIIQRLVLLLVCTEENLPDILITLLLGAWFDAGFLSVLFFIICLIPPRIPEKARHAVVTVALLIWLLLNAFDLFSLKFNGVRSNLNSLNLFKFRDIIGSVWGTGVTYIFIALLILGTAFILKKAWRIYLPQPVSLKQRATYLIIFFIGSFIYLPFPMSYYSDQVPVSKQLRHLAINPYHAWFTSLWNVKSTYLTDPEEAMAYFAREDGYGSSDRNFIRRPVAYSDTTFDNVIIVIMESFGANRIGTLNGRRSLSPSFDALVPDGTLYRKCYATGPRTQYALSSIFYGFPHILGYNLFRENKQKFRFTGLSKLLGPEGYRSHFLHAGRADYDDMSLLLTSDDTVKIVDQFSISKFKFRNTWGVDDESFYAYATKYMHSQKGKNVFCLLSMSNHEPFQLPVDFNTNSLPADISKKEKAYAYSDYALGQLIVQLKRSGLYDRSLIIITGDHGERYSGEDTETKLYHVPLLIIDHKHANAQINKPVSHADIAEYILKRTSYKGTSHFIGRGLVSPTNNVYYRDYENNLFKVTETSVYRCKLFSKDLDQLQVDESGYVKNITKVADAHLADKIKKDMISFYTTIQFIFENGLYN
jgi:phosphoglycerol transferase MdoB-like AlkP superfamily enzyme